MNQKPHSWRASEYTETQLADLREWTGMSETTILATLIAEKHAVIAAERKAKMEDMMGKQVILYVENPEKCNDQGVAVRFIAMGMKADRDYRPDGFDYNLPDAPIRDQDSARVWVDSEFKPVGQITLIWL